MNQPFQRLEYHNDKLTGHSFIYYKHKTFRKTKISYPLIRTCKGNTHSWVFSHFFNCTDGTKSCKA